MRLGLLFLGAVFAIGLVEFRLFEKQVLDHGRYVQASEYQSVSNKAQAPSRGRIFSTDLTGKLYPLAVSQWRYQLLVSPRQVKNKQKLAESLAVDLSVPAEEIFQTINNNKVYVPPIRRGLDEEMADRLSQKDYGGVFLLPELTRVYPEGTNIAPQILGFVGADGEGKYGVEALYDELLRGKSGSQTVKRDSLGRLIDILSGIKPENGSDLTLTLDYNLQFMVETKLQEALQEYQADSGTILVLDPKTGAIRAIAGAPKYDPNTFSQIKAEDQRLFLSSAFSDLYEPGSVFKPLTMAAALDSGAVTPDTTNTFGKTVTVSGYEINNAEDKVYGKETMGQVLENSDNVAMVWVAQQLGSENQRAYLEKYGFGQKSALGLVGEQGGKLRPKEEWNDLLRSTAAFGQGISVNLVQLASAYAIIANNGLTVTPQLVSKAISAGNEKVFEPKTGTQAIKPETASAVRTMLAGVVERGHGKRAGINGVKVGGKTGTAQVPNPEGGYYDDRHIGTFVGMFPIEDPKFVMAVRLDNPKTVRFAESSAAPTFGKIADWMATYYGLR